MLQTEILRDLIDLMEEYGKLFKASESPRLSTTEIYDMVSASSPFIAMQKKYGLRTEAVHRIITSMSYVRPTQKCLSEILEIIESGDAKGPVMPADEKASNAYSAWAREKGEKCLDLFLKENENAKSPFRCWYHKGMHEAYNDAAHMFEVLTTRRKHLPPEIKPYLEKEGAL